MYVEDLATLAKVAEAVGVIAVDHLAMETNNANLVFFPDQQRDQKELRRRQIPEETMLVVPRAKLAVLPFKVQPINVEVGNCFRGSLRV